MRLRHIYRYPVKGFTPDPLEHCDLEPGRGVPFDRAAAFTSGNLKDPPRKNGWVPARTFLQLTVYPELARFRTDFNEARGTITLTTPNGATAEMGLGQPDSFAHANALVREHFGPGPHGLPELHEQAPDHGHFDFTDSKLSVCNLETVRALGAAAGRELDPLRFRANLYLDGLEAWQEFGLIGHRLRIGDSDIEVMRPVMRCAATSVDPDAGEVNVDVPDLLHRTAGHMFLAVYARVVSGGPIRCGDAIVDLGPTGRNPADGQSPSAPKPRQWPRIVELRSKSDGNATLASTNDAWPLPGPRAGATIRIHPGSGGIAAPTPLTLTSRVDGAYVVARSEAFDKIEPGTRLIMTGPYDSR
jgi:uncharacterized protein YcbX